MPRRTQRIDLKHDTIKSDPGCDGLKPTGVVVAPVTGDAPTNFPDEEPRPITHQNIKQLAGFEPSISLEVANRLTDRPATLPVHVTFNQGTEHWIESVVAQTPELRYLHDKLLGLYELRTKLMTRRGREIERQFAELLNDPGRLQLLAAQCHGAGSHSGEPTALPSDSSSTDLG